jgi:hypothetical protein
MKKLRIVDCGLWIYAIEALSGVIPDHAGLRIFFEDDPKTL